MSNVQYRGQAFNQQGLNVWSTQRSRGTRMHEKLKALTHTIFHPI
jgi:hypothetical protein